MDNRFVERLWQSLKYEAVYLGEIVGGHHARRLIGSWFDHNHRRPHLAFGGRTPVEVVSVMLVERAGRGERAHVVRDQQGMCVP